jgi:catalase
MADEPTFTASAGAPVAAGQSSLTAGSRGALLQDCELIENCPERPV